MKALKLKNVLPLILISLLLINCSKSDSIDEDNNAPGLFSANSTEVKFDGATIVWTESNDIDDDPVTYSVYLGGTKVASGLTILTFPLSGLEPETRYEGYIESNDGRGGKSKADFSFTTGPELILLTLNVEIKEFRATSTVCASKETLEIDAGVLIPKYEGNVTYNVSFSPLKLNGGATTVPATSRTWTNTNFQPYYVYDNANVKEVEPKFFFVWQAGAGGCSDEDDDKTRAFYANPSGIATVTIVIKK